MSHHQGALKELMRRPSDQIDLARAALLVSCEAYADLDIAHYLAMLDDLARAARDRMRPSDGPFSRLQILNGFLFDEMGFRGNEEDYYDPRNSYLNEVLDRRLGIPITLSILYIAVAERAGMEVSGVSMPGHFLIKHSGVNGDIVLDPYLRGIPLSSNELRQRIQAFGGETADAARFLSAATKRQVITRLLGNLKRVHRTAGAHDAALGAVGMILAINPWDLDEIRDRGMIQRDREAYAEAVGDLDIYLAYRPDAPDAADVRQNVEALRPRLRPQDEGGAR
ncbi:MAG: tetratricopeptide repeat protein [Dehalococcoidia bacterium]|nr:tetratricopeptide repeat protein [Dehalococcoidia bacterium]